MYILSPIANTVLRNATGYFSFHYRRYFRTPSLSCPITLSGTPPISSAMSRGRVEFILLHCVFVAQKYKGDTEETIVSEERG